MGVLPLPWKHYGPAAVLLPFKIYYFDQLQYYPAQLFPGLFLFSVLELPVHFLSLLIKTKTLCNNDCKTPLYILVYYYFLLFFLMTAMASTSMLATCMSFPVAVLMMRTLNIRIIIECFIDKRFYCFIRISGNSSEKLNAGCR